MTFQYALGRTEGRRTINVPHSTVFSSLLRPNRQAQELFGDRASLTRPEEVDVRRLDSVLEELGEVVDTSRLFLKIDTQGFDLEVFAGLGRWTGEVAALQSELSVVPLYERMPDMLEALAVYESSGFVISGIYPVSVDEESLRTIEFDCMMVRNSRV
jgi:FkbM family methyltransferase